VLTKCKQYSDAAVWQKPRTEAKWLKLREGDITATAAAALFGASPYMTPFDLFHRLAGNMTVVIEESERMLWGKRLQDSIAAGICEDNGWKIVDGHPFLYARSKLLEGMAASPDYIIEDVARPELGYGSLEIKNVDYFIAKDDWSDEESPAHIELQLQHQLAVCGLSWGAVGGLIGGNKSKVFRRDADVEVMEAIFHAAREMFDRVKRNDPPAPDYGKDYETIRTLYKHATIGKSINLEFPDDAETDVEKLTALIEQKYNADIAFKLAEEDKKRAAAELLDFIQDTESVIGNGWKVIAGTTHKQAYTAEVKASTFRTLKVSKPKPKKEKS
jgi:putative phage-type endonuclease